MPGWSALMMGRGVARRGPVSPLVLCAALTVLGAWAAGCPSPRFADCEVRCAESGVCPSGLECGANGYCYRELPAAGSDSCAAGQDAASAADPDAGSAADPDADSAQEPDAKAPEGAFTLLWTLTRDGESVTCAEVGAETVVVSSEPADEPGSAYDDLFDCPAAETQDIVVTEPLPVGEYTVTVTLGDAVGSPVHDALSKVGSIDGNEPIVDLGFFEFALD